MTKSSAKAFLSIAVAANLSIVSAAAPAIGVALSSGSITINNARAQGNASIFEGSTVETGDTGSRIQLKSGASLQLATSSRGQVFGDKFVLEKGNTQVYTAKPFEIDTQVVSITGVGSSSAQVSLRGQTVQVASLTGTLKIANTSGVFVTAMAPGTSLEFSAADTDSQTPPPSTDPNDPNNPNNKKKKKRAGAAVVGGASAGFIVAGVLVAGTAVGLGVYYGTQGTTSPQACMSPCQTH